MTPDGVRQLAEFVVGVRPHQVINQDAWRGKLDERDVSDDDALAAVFALADDHDRDITVAMVVDRVRHIRAERAAPSTRAAAWGDRDPDDRVQYVDAAMSYLRVCFPSAPNGSDDIAGLTPIGRAVPPIRRDSAWVQAIARHLAAGGAWEPALPPAGSCRGCAGQLRLVDRDTATAKCDLCYCEVILSTGDTMNPEPPQRGVRAVQVWGGYERCVTCGSTLLGYDPAGDRCRNCATVTVGA